MLKALIHEKINEVFLEYQKANNINSGDIDPWDAQRLERMENGLVALIEQICAYQKKQMMDDFTPSWYIYTDSEGIAHSETFGKIDMDQFFYKVSKRIAFDDINDETVHNIYFRGNEVFYVGYQPGMKYEYQDLKGNTIWVGSFPEWDH
jgi:hypothetical protein